MICLETYAKSNGIRNFLITFTDLFGVLRSKLVPISAISNMQKKGAGFAGFATHLDMTAAYPDTIAMPDPDSIIQLPWKKEIAWVASDLIVSNKLLSQCPRNTLKRVVNKAQTLNYSLKTGVECEFFLLDFAENSVADKRDRLSKPCYDQLALMRQYDLICQISDYMEELGWNPYQSDHEDANGQFEMNWEFADCLVTADRHSFFKFMVKTLAEEKGLRASFMPKPFGHLTGNGCHIHLSLWDKQNKNLFCDEKKELGLSDIAYYFLGGVLNSAPALCAITNPTVNSYKRINASTTLSGTTWAPNTISYAGNNRTHMIRIPDNERLELRSPDGAANPYLMQAAILSAGLDGIINKVSPGDRSDTDVCNLNNKDIRRMPTTLIEALRSLENSTVLKEYLGNSFIKSYIKLKEQEWGEYLSQVSEWERKVYLDV